MVIAIEGMDGVGKSTIAQYIAKKYNFTYIDKPVKYIFANEKKKEQLDDILNTVYDLEDPVIKTWFFGIGNLIAIRKFENKNIVLDRHFVSNYFWNSTDKKECKIIYEALFKIVGKPDITILLYADTKNRAQRIKIRNENDPDLIDSLNDDNEFMKMVNFVRNNNMNYALVNTNNITIEEVETKIDKIVLNQLCKGENEDDRFERCN